MRPGGGLYAAVDVLTGRADGLPCLEALESKVEKKKFLLQVRLTKRKTPDTGLKKKISAGKCSPWR